MLTKRERTTTKETETTLDTTTQQQHGNTTKRTRRIAESNTQREWPAFFIQLQRVYHALNTVFTFCSTRKHLHTTIENMRSSVEGLIKGQLELEAIAQIKTLLPDLIRFTYVDKDTLAALDEISASAAKKHRSSKNLSLYDPQAGDQEVIQVLLFQFLDGEIKTALKHARKLPRQHHARLKNPSGSSSRPAQDTALISAHDLQTPSYSPKMMIKMVEKRNLKFKEAVNELLDACAAEDPPLDPAQLLVECAVPHHPTLKSQNFSHAYAGTSNLPANVSSSASSSSREVPTIEAVLEQLKASAQYRGQIVENGEHVTPARPACFQDLQHAPLSPQLLQTLESSKGITRLYSHQARAIDLLATGANVVVTTSTSSGKSLIYQVPMLQALEFSQASCGLYIFPTKALAQDQKRSLEELLHSYGEPLSRLVRVHTYDGDTPTDERAGIRKQANVVFTNPDMLHASILPHEELWRRFFQNLRFVVVDELHIYAGPFGSHVAMIMRRLRRMCEAVGNPAVRFISCSATTRNAQAHMKSLFGFEEEVELVEEDGAPAGIKRQVVWNPPLVDDKDPGQGRVSAIGETSRVLRFLMERNVRTIVFCRIRRTCELLMKQVQEDLAESGHRELQGQVRAYRAGYTAQERRLIEAQMFGGQLTGIIATTALELGIDIGALDAVISLGVPHSLAGLIQQAGRAGRRSKESLAMLVLEQRGVDQHYASHPEELFGARGSPSVSLDVKNERLLLAHLQCAAHEIPVVPASDAKFFGPRVAELCAQHLAVDEQGFFHAREPHSAAQVSIRGLPPQHQDGDDDGNYSIIDVTDPQHPKILEEIEPHRVLHECFEGAVFLHQGVSLLVIHLDLPRRSVSVRNAAVHYLTQPILVTTIFPLKALHHAPILPDSSTFVFFGKVQITTTITGYLKLDAKNRGKVLERVEMLTTSAGGVARGGGGATELADALAVTTKGAWIEIPHTLVQALAAVFKAMDPAEEEERRASSRYYPLINLAIHLLEHLLILAVCCASSNAAKDPDPHQKHPLPSAPLDQLHHPLRTSCTLFKAASFPSALPPAALSSPRSSDTNGSLEEGKLMERIMVYEDPQKSLDRSLLSSCDGETKEDGILDASPLAPLFLHPAARLTEILDLLDRCVCVDGCRACVYKPLCPHVMIPIAATGPGPSSPQNIPSYKEGEASGGDHDAGIKFAVRVLANGLLDRVWVPDEV
ncbi:hypothetical protein PCANC_16937 [Puccinia coronata f. sp. avenae]|uniref:P-loop containing nucleoside triphosphate hydrolase protein n=1 Tax=Puccinia coronata f. sp. avenae TaxID=200324 RepID=A0A2N5V5L3_9BASI|nr:hypothetical protein PCANC_16937 [Puccinia coronata f. sp. avenae]